MPITAITATRTATAAIAMGSVKSVPKIMKVKQQNNWSYITCSLWKRIDKISFM